MSSEKRPADCDAHSPPGPPPPEVPAGARAKARDGPGDRIHAEAAGDVAPPPGPPPLEFPAEDRARARDGPGDRTDAEAAGDVVVGAVAVVPRPTDVLWGQGCSAAASTQRGNAIFRAIVRRLYPMYRASSKYAEKRRVAEGVVYALSLVDPPVRFLEWSSVYVRWDEMLNEDVFKKAHLALTRDFGRIMREEDDDDLGAKAGDATVEMLELEKRMNIKGPVVVLGSGDGDGDTWQKKAPKTARNNDDRQHDDNYAGNEEIREAKRKWERLKKNADGSGGDDEAIGAARRVYQALDQRKRWSRQRASRLKKENNDDDDSYDGNEDIRAAKREWERLKKSADDNGGDDEAIGAARREYFKLKRWRQEHRKRRRSMALADTKSHSVPHCQQPRSGARSAQEMEVSQPAQKLPTVHDSHRTVPTSNNGLPTSNSHPAAEHQDRANNLAGLRLPPSPGRLNNSPVFDSRFLTAVMEMDTLVQRRAFLARAEAHIRHATTTPSEAEFLDASGRESRQIDALLRAVTDARGGGHVVPASMAPPAVRGVPGGRGGAAPPPDAGAGKGSGHQGGSSSPSAAIDAASAGPN